MPRLRIPVANLPPEGIDVVGEIMAEDVLGDDWSDGRLRCPFALHYELHAAPVRGGVLITGSASSTAVAQCDRCLTSFRLPLVVQGICHFVRMPEEGYVDLTEEMREDILLALPDHLLCREDCRGLCPTCGGDLNRGPCGCPPAATRASDVWAGLDLLEL